MPRGKICHVGESFGPSASLPIRVLEGSTRARSRSRSGRPLTGLHSQGQLPGRAWGLGGAALASEFPEPLSPMPMAVLLGEALWLQ